MNLKSSICPFGKRLQHYWEMRYFLFSKFDEGIKLDKVGLYSVKTEESAKEISNFLKGEIIVDAFGGIGGSTIAFALAGKKVICIENNEIRLNFAKHNAKIYGVFDSIEFILGDCLDIIPTLKFDSIYFDPPWVGEMFFSDRNRTFRRLSYKSLRLLIYAKKMKASVGFTVPHNYDFNQVSKFNTEFCVKFSYLNGRKLYATFFLEYYK